MTLTIVSKSDMSENKYDTSCNTYDSIEDFFLDYGDQTLSDIPTSLVEDDYFHISSRSMYEHHRKAIQCLQEGGVYASYFEDTELVFVFLDNKLIYNIWENEYSLTNKLLFSWLAKLKLSNFVNFQKENLSSLNIFLSKYSRKVINKSHLTSEHGW